MRLGRVITAIVVLATGCIFRKPTIEPVNLGVAQSTESTVKAHLLDGSTVIYPTGFFINGKAVIKRGTARRYSLGTLSSTDAGPIPLDSVVGMEAYGTKYNVPASVVATVGGIALGTVAAAGLAVAIFGSCPTFYSDSAGTELLQGEGFSYAIAPLFEQRDVDRLRLVTAKDGRIVLHVRNEALETHYINHLELLEIDRAADETALGDNTGHPIAVRNLLAPAVVRDRAGRDVTRDVAALDERVYSSAPETIRNVSASNLDDFIDLAVPASNGADSVAIVLDMRNSLLNTVLLYDYMLAAPGARSLDFLAKDLNRISGAVDLGRWYASRMGMRVSVLDHGQYRQVARLGDSGPIAFHKVAVVVPAIRGDDGMLHVRLSFVADDWRIDGIAIASDWRRPAFRFVSPARVSMPEASQNAAALAAIGDADESYLQTSPGQALSVEFDVGSKPSPRSWLLASQGYYTEWIRGAWIKSATGKQFVPDDVTLADAVASWHAKQKEMEKQFYNSRIAAR
jgi:hypothetical protein